MILYLPAVHSAKKPKGRSDPMKILLTALSDPLRNLDFARQLRKEMKDCGIYVDFGIIKKQSATPKEKAEALNKAMRSDTFDYIIDISGGNLANTVLGWIDYEAYARCKALFVGFSDLSCVLNALYCKTGKTSWLYPVYYQSDPLKLYAFLTGQDSPDTSLQIFSFRSVPANPFFLGGNARCTLKLAGTSYMPDFHGTWIILEGMGTSQYELISMLAQYEQIGVLDACQGIMFGWFSSIFSNFASQKEIVDFLAQIVEMIHPGLNWMFTPEIGHIQNCKPVRIGIPEPLPPQQQPSAAEH